MPRGRRDDNSLHIVAREGGLELGMELVHSEAELILRREPGLFVDIDTGGETERGVGTDGARPLAAAQAQAYDG
jgi:hypothetical protein